MSLHRLVWADLCQNATLLEISCDGSNMYMSWKCTITGKANIKHTEEEMQKAQFKNKWAVTCDFQQCGILTSVDSDESVQPPFKARNCKWCSVSSLALIEYTSDKQWLWSVCAHAQAGLSLSLSHIPHCWKSHVAAQICFISNTSKNTFS